jgi:site-specific DNA-cytosine methylase
MGIAGHFNNIWDLESRYREALNWHLQECGMELHEIVLNLGKSTGDLLSAALEHLQPADFLIAGCPCPPWAGNGMRRSVKDPRAKVLIAVMCWVFYLVHHGGLLCAILENVVGIIRCAGNREAAMTHFTKVLNDFIPEFIWHVLRASILFSGYLVG